MLPTAARQAARGASCAKTLLWQGLSACRSAPETAEAGLASWSHFAAATAPIPQNPATFAVLPQSVSSFPAVRGLATSPSTSKDSAEEHGSAPGTSEGGADSSLRQSGAEASASARAEAAHAHAAAEASGTADTSAQSLEQLQEQLTQRDAMLLEKDGQIEEITERSLRALADLENLRERSARQAETTRKFAVQGFAKSLLEVADNLERALGSAGEEQQQLSADTALAQLQSLRGGLNLTQKILMQVFQQHGLSRFEALGETFDPNLHMALFEIPDPSKPAGTVATVTKAGYKLHDRILRPAEVGVVRAQDGSPPGGD